MKAFIISALAALAVAAPIESRGTDAPYGNKKGLCYNNGAATNVLSRAGSATWAYNWGTAANAPKFQQIPMVWGPGGDVAGALARVKAGAPWVLGYNEPDEAQGNGGSHTSPGQAVAAWGNDMFKLADAGAKLVCPAITSWDTNAGHTGGPAGFTWLKQFAGNNPNQFRCSAQALHWYGVAGKSGADQAKLFIDYVKDANTKVNGIFKKNMDLWITEFAPLPVHDANVMADFLKVAIPFLDGASYVARYSPFMAEDLVSGNSLNAAGNAFVNTK